MNNSIKFLKNYDPTISVIKGIGIILVVLGHTGGSITHYIYLFHMLLFFMLSGYTLKEKYWMSKTGVVQFIKKKIIKLYLPYIAFNIIFLLLNNFFIYINFIQAQSLNFKQLVLSLFKVLMFSGGTEMGGALWFLRVLFFLSIGYIIVRYFIYKFNSKNNDIFIWCISFILLVIGYICSKNNILLNYNISSCFTLFIFLHLGNYFKKNFFLFQCGVKKSIIIIALLFPITLFLNKIEKINIGLNQYNNPISLLLCGLIFWIIIWCLSSIISNKYLKLRRILIIVSDYNIWILGLHFLGFRIASVFIVISLSYPSLLISKHPVISSKYWIIYLLFGILIPIFFEKTVKIITERRKYI